MLEDVFGKKVQIKTGSEGEVSELGLNLTDVEGALIKVRDSHCK